MTSYQPESSTKIEAKCMCGQLTASVEVPNSELPIPMGLCSCDTCRHVSGQLAITSVDIHRSIDVQGKPISYTTSEGPKGLSRCFCGTCGATVYEDCPSPSRIGFAGGALTRTEGIVETTGQIFVSDTKDGGIREWLPDIPAYKTDRDGPAAELVYSKQMLPGSSSSEDRLHCKCRCGGVQFDVTRPNVDSSKPHAPYSDSIVPHQEEQKAKNVHDEKWWIKAEGTKYAAGICVCNSCRKASGYDLQAWAFIPRNNMLQSNGDIIDFAMGTLRRYDSAKDVHRYFCGTCGATIFYQVDDRPDILDLSVGLCEAPSGARAEEWFEWVVNWVSYIEFGQNKALVDALSKGLAEWHEKTGKGWRK